MSRTTATPTNNKILYNVTVEHKNHTTSIMPVASENLRQLQEQCKKQGSSITDVKLIKVTQG